MSNNMCSRNVSKQWLIDNNEPPVSGNKIVLGVTLPAVSYQPFEFGASQVITAQSDKLNTKNGVFIAEIISRLMYQFSYQNKPGLEIYKNLKTHLPIKTNNQPDYTFMESFIAELEAERITKLEAYLLENGLKDYVLTDEEQKVLNNFENRNFEFLEFSYKSIFNKIVQGRRLKKDDQMSGDIPFVMAGVTNTGVVSYISNPVAKFSKNSITIDIFGNTFYRNYDFGAGDDTGVYWSDEKQYSKKTMLFFATSMEKSISGKFDFGNKLRSSQSFGFTMKLPAKNNQPDYATMETLISAIQKLVIKDVVLYVDRKLAASKQIVDVK